MCPTNPRPHKSIQVTLTPFIYSNLQAKHSHTRPDEPTQSHHDPEGPKRRTPPLNILEPSSEAPVGACPDEPPHSHHDPGGSRRRTSPSIYSDLQAKPGRALPRRTRASQIFPSAQNEKTRRNYTHTSSEARSGPVPTNPRLSSRSRYS